MGKRRYVTKEMYRNTTASYVNIQNLKYPITNIMQTLLSNLPQIKNNTKTTHTSIVFQLYIHQTHCPLISLIILL